MHIVKNIKNQELENMQESSTIFNKQQFTHYPAFEKVHIYVLDWNAGYCLQQNTCTGKVVTHTQNIWREYIVISSGLTCL